MRALQLAVIAMGVLIVGGTVTLGVLIAKRLGSVGTGGPVEAALREPPGTRIAGSAAAGDRLVLQLQGGGPDRVVVLDLRSGAVLLRTGLLP